MWVSVLQLPFIFLLLWLCAKEVRQDKLLVISWQFVSRTIIRNTKVLRRRWVETFSAAAKSELCEYFPNSLLQLHCNGWRRRKFRRRKFVSRNVLHYGDGIHNVVQYCRVNDIHPRIQWDLIVIQVRAQKINKSFPRENMKFASTEDVFLISPFLLLLLLVWLGEWK